MYAILYYRFNIFCHRSIFPRFSDLHGIKRDAVDKDIWLVVHIDGLPGARFLFN